MNKNIHLLPTSNPSKIGYHSDTIKEGRWDYAPNFGFSEFNKDMNFQHNPYNIHITNDEEIKKGDWVFINVNRDGKWVNAINKVTKIDREKLSDTKCISIEPNKTNDYNWSFLIHCKKIILTTDTDIIKDGVQAIDDKFLEWSSNSMNQIHAHKTGLKRSLKGENSNRAILTNEKVLDMKNKYKSGSKIKDLHKEFGIKYTTCWHIVKGNGHSLGTI